MKFIDISKQQFGRWTVVRRVANHKGANQKGSAMWLCICVCGTKKVIAGKQLRSKKSRLQSCGCAHSDILKKAWSKHPVVKMRRKALGLKEKFYYTGIPCSRGHLAWRRTSDRNCVACTDERAARELGIPKATRKSPTKCECCGNSQTQRLSRDHSHKTQKFRGWLCINCNLGIGKLGDNVAGLRRAIEYLKRAH